MDFSFLYRPFKEDIGFKRLFAYWLFFMVIGIVAMNLLTPLSPAFVEREKEITSTEQFCTAPRLAETGLAFLTESVVFFILPWRFKGKKGAIFGISIWIGLHALSLNIPIAVYIACMGYFFYRCLEIGRWRELLLFHLIPNSIAIISCFA